MAKISGPTTLGLRVMHSAGGEVEDLFAAMFQQAAQVAVADEADQVVTFHHRRHTQLLRDIS